MDALVQKHRMAPWVGKLLIVLSLAVSWEVRAAVESVAPLYSNGYTTADVATWEVACHANGCLPGGTCMAYDKLMPDPYSAVGSGYLFCGAFFTSNNVFTGNGIWRIVPVCPTPTVNPGVPYTYNPTTQLCERPILACPAHAHGTPCACDAGYQFDAAGTSCVSTCPVGALTAPPFSDACSTSLEQGKGVDVNNACGTLREPDMVNAASCSAAKIHALNIPYTQPSSTIRTTAYQNHLLEIWTKSQQLDTIMNSVVYLPEVKQACAQRNVEVNNEKAQHGIDSPPSPSGRAAPHVEHRAIDVPRRVAKALMDQVTTYTTTYMTVNGQRTPIQEVASDVEDYMHSAPNACDANLSWGGRFDPEDDVHFQLP